MSLKETEYNSTNVPLENLKIMLDNQKFSEICRICLKTASNVTSLFGYCCDNVIIAERISDVALINIKMDDCLPQVICAGCQSDLNLAFEFKKRCIDSHNLLKQFKNNIFIDVAGSVINDVVVKKEYSNNSDFNRINDDDETDATELKAESGCYRERTIKHIKNANKQYCCSICKKIYKDKNRFRIHAKTAHTHDEEERECYSITGTGKERVFHCMRCEYSSMKKKQVEVHYLRHTGAQPHTCDLCPAKYRQMSSLIRHKQTHSTETPYACEHCPKQFKHRYALKQHSVTHKTELHYKCDICKKAFKWKHILNDHIMRHETERTLNCEVCGILFNSRVDLNRHKQIHLTDRTYSCNSCNFTTHVKRYLNRHIMTHTGVQRCACKICGKIFSKKGNLTAHQVVHSDVRQFHCDLCDKKYKHKAVLKSHMQLHHGVERNHDVSYRTSIVNKNGDNMETIRNSLENNKDKVSDNNLKNTKEINI